MRADRVQTSAKLATRSVMSPGLWLIALVGIPCVSGAVVAQGWIEFWLLAIFTVLSIGTFSIFVMHSLKNPTLLQSEDYLLKRDAMTIYGSSSYSGEEIVSIINSENASKQELQVTRKEA